MQSGYFGSESFGVYFFPTHSRYPILISYCDLAFVFIVFIGKNILSNRRAQFTFKKISIIITKYA